MDLHDKVFEYDGEEFTLRHDFTKEHKRIRSEILNDYLDSHWQKKRCAKHLTGKRKFDSSSET